MINTPIRKIKTPEGLPVKDEKGNQLYLLHNRQMVLEPGLNITTYGANRLTRRKPLQKSFRNIFYGIHVGSKYIQVIYNKETRKPEKVIDHWPFNPNKNEK